MTKENIYQCRDFCGIRNIIMNQDHTRRSMFQVTFLKYYCLCPEDKINRKNIMLQAFKLNINSWFVIDETKYKWLVVITFFVDLELIFILVEWFIMCIKPLLYIWFINTRDKIMGILVQVSSKLYVLCDNGYYKNITKHFVRWINSNSITCPYF